MKDILEIVGVILAVFAFVAVLMVGLIAFTDWKGSSDCEDFCEARGHDSHFNSSLGCFCDDANGERYNPEYLVPPGTSISITE